MFCTSANAQNRYGFDFSGEWDWVDLYLNQPENSQAINPDLKYLLEEYTVQEGRILFNNLSVLDSMNEIKKLTKIIEKDNLPAVLKKNTISALSDFDQRNSFQGIIHTARILTELFHPRFLSIKNFGKDIYYANLSAIPPENLIISFNYSEAHEIMDYVERKHDAKNDSVLYSFYQGQDKEFILNSFDYSRNTDPLCRVYKIIYPASFNHLGGVSVYSEEFRQTLDSMPKNETQLINDIRYDLSLYLPEGLNLAGRTEFSFGGNTEILRYDSNKIKLRYEYFCDNFDKMKKYIVREFFLQGMEKLEIDVWHYLVEPKDSVLLSVMSGIFKGGTANYIAPVYSQNRPLSLLEKDFYYFRETIRGMRYKRIAGLTDSLISEGFKEGGPYFTMGTQMAYSIDKVLGRKIFRNCLKCGPVTFFKLYFDACEQDEKNIREVFRFPDWFKEKIIKMSENFPDFIFADMSDIKIKNLSRDELLKEISLLEKKYKDSARLHILQLLAAKLLESYGFTAEAESYYQKSLYRIQNKN